MIAAMSLKSASLATPRSAARRFAAALTACAALAAFAPGTLAQDAAPAAGDWGAGVEIKTSAPSQAAKPNTTVIERSGSDGKAANGAAAPGVKLVALLTDNGQQIDQGLVWRVFQHAAEAGGKSKLVMENREPSPTLKLAPGDYTVNAAFGRANLTRKVTVKAGAPSTEQFVLNAGGLRMTALVGGKPAASGAVSYAVYADDHEQLDGRTAVMASAKPGLIVRLNAGIYRVVSTYGDANAKVESDVTVEAGKLTDATVTHTAGKASFKLVTRAGGDALPDAHWTIQSAAGETVKESVGALPTHVLAPGDYTVTVKSAGHLFSRTFAIKDQEAVSVEVLMDKNAPLAEPVRATGAEPDAAGASTLEPDLEIKIP
jgi:hypothetical protein